MGAWFCGTAGCSLLTDFDGFSGSVGDASATDSAAGDGAADVFAHDAADSEAGYSIDLSATKDAYVHDGTNANTNYASDSYLWVKQSTAGNNRHTWVSFDIGGYSRIASAKLRLYLDILESGATGPVQVDLCYAPTASDGWNETTLTWNDQPATGPIVTALTVDAPNLNTFVEWDVTAQVQSDTDGVATVVLEGDPSTSRGAIFSSSRRSQMPELRITQ
jgi:hypothetical protein